jgi:predicted DsbA family dithiol-disulfide isomerase
VRWRPFELNPNLPGGKGYDKMNYYEQRFGADMVGRMIPRMKAVAEEYGIKMEYGGHIGNTFNSHRLIWKAREEGGSDLQDKVVESLFKAYFEENKSLGELTVLEDCASRAGYSDSLEFLRSELGEHEVKEEIQLFGRDFQCTGVPMFIIDDGKFILNGAQESDQFLRVFAKLS